MAEKQKRTTILDIAREVNVSTATVSRVLSSSGYPVKENLKLKILKAAERLKYQPNIFSQVLKGGVNKVIGVMLPSLTNPFYSQLASDTERYCVAAGYLPIICSSSNSPLLEQSHLDTLLRQQVAGIILSTINTNAEFISALGAIPVPCVLFDQSCPQYRGCGVVFDFHKGSYLATRHLIDCGHKRIAFASPPLDRASRRLRYEGYCDAMRAGGAGLAPERAILAAGTNADNTVRSDYDAGRILAHMMLEDDNPPEAVLAVNDITAIGILNALAEKGVRVPDEISLIGFDDINFAAMTTPALSTVRQSTAQTAESAVAMLLKRIADPSLPPETVVIEPEIVIRASVLRNR